MSFQVPEHVQPIRAEVERFIVEKVYPVEGVLEERGTDEGRRVMAGLMQEAKEAGLWALGHPKEIGGQGHAVSRLRLRERGGRSLDAGDGRAGHALVAGLDHAERVRVARMARQLPEAARRRVRSSRASA